VKILGLVAKTHDSGLALLSDGTVDYVLEEERFDRRKKSQKFPRHSLAVLMSESGLSLSDIDVVTTPWHVPSLRRFAAGLLLRRFPVSLCLLHPAAHRAQQNQIMRLDHYLRKGLTKHFGAGAKLPPIVNVHHHHAHAASYFVSPFEEAMVLVMDGYGDDASTSAYVGRGNRLERLWHTTPFNSIGLVYTFVTEYLGFAGFGDEGKVMALAAFGDNAYVARFREIMRPTPDGSYAVDMSYFAYETYGELRPFTRKFYDVFGPPRAQHEPLDDRHRAIAYALQAVTEEIVLHVVRGLVARTGLTNLCMTGGVALNCVANAKVLADTPVQRLWVPPCASDTGAPLGSALWHYHQTLGRQRTFELTHPFYGKAYSDSDIEQALAKAGLAAQRLDDGALIDRVADELAAGKVVGWYQGRFEMGPRALGNRSILADPRRAEMRDILNAKIKARENFRPFAPAVTIERAAEFFEITQPDPFMTLAPRVRPEKRADIAAAVHVDGTGRIQTVERSANPRYWDLITAFGARTGVPVLLNTSFNRKEPIVSSPAEAVACFLESGMDVLVLGNYFVAVNPNAKPR
jgi:carbamoyltransferase